MIQVGYLSISSHSPQLSRCAPPTFSCIYLSQRRQARVDELSRVPTQVGIREAGKKYVLSFTACIGEHLSTQETPPVGEVR